MNKISLLPKAGSVSAKITSPCFLIQLDIHSEDMALVSAILQRANMESRATALITILSLLSIKIKELNHDWIHEPFRIDISSIKKLLEDSGTMDSLMTELARLNL